LAEKVVGHGRLWAVFERALESGRLAHAYVLVGPSSVGKWTFARALAARLVCAKPASRAGGGREACGACGPCVRLAAGTHPDVTLLDARAEGSRGLGVEETRDRIVDALRLRPHDAPVRVVAVNDAERMEPAAQNALLKTLEEPPPRSLLLLVATETAALLETVVSRCFLLRFAPVPEAELAAGLAARGIDPRRASELAALSGGVPGRAIAWEDDAAGGLGEIARACLRGEVSPSTLAAGLGKTTGDSADGSAFERRRQAALALCAALAREVRAALEADPDDAPAAARLERIVEAAREVAASVTPELAVDRLAREIASGRAA